MNKKYDLTGKRFGKLTVISPESRIHRYYCPVCGKQQKSKADGDTWYCERCGEKLKMVRDSG